MTDFSEHDGATFVGIPQILIECFLVLDRLSAHSVCLLGIYIPTGIIERNVSMFSTYCISSCYHMEKIIPFSKYPNPNTLPVSCSLSSILSNESNSISLASLLLKLVRFVMLLIPPLACTDSRTDLLHLLMLNQTQ